MISVSKLICGYAAPGDSLRYERHALRRGKSDRDVIAPVVVWNMTRRCNLRCVHCYYDAAARRSPGELTREEGKQLIEDLADFGVPVLLFSGGEPLMREDLFELGEMAVKHGLRTVISTNGTLIDGPTARRIHAAGFAYVGISLDGIGGVNDRFRGVEGAFDRALAAFRSLRELGQRVGLRLTLTSHNVAELPAIFELIEKEEIERACFYHLVYSGRGDSLRTKALSHAQTRKVLDLIIEKTLDFHNRGLTKEILTVDNHADGPYIYLKALKEYPHRAAEIYELLRLNGGNSSGVGIACVDSQGNVHPDQFWRQHTLGNLRQNRFSQIWMDSSNGFLTALRRREEHIHGRCAAGNCKWFDICAGNFRARAEAVFQDPWAPDPACYLTDDEITECPS